jgi:hypothetical protein
MEHEPIDGCRLEEFERWDRVTLQHERAYISKQIDKLTAFSSVKVMNDLMHALVDIDSCLAKLPPPNNPSPLGGPGAR